MTCLGIAGKGSESVRPGESVRRGGESTRRGGNESVRLERKANQKLNASLNAIEAHLKESGKMGNLEAAFRKPVALEAEMEPMATPRAKRIRL